MSLSRLLIGTNASRFLVILFGVLGGGHCLGQERISPIPDFDPAGLVRFTNIDTVEARRAELIQYIWPDGMPTSIPHSTTIEFPVDLSAIDESNVASVERLECDVARFAMTSIAYRIFPKSDALPEARYIVHAGHMREGGMFALEAGLAETIDFLLENNCEVVVMQMPLVAWNQDQTIKVNGRTSDSNHRSIERTLAHRGTSGHNELFEVLEPEYHGEAFAVFLEPVVQVVNLFVTTEPSDRTLGMIGLSGGGWTTHMAAAVDSRIDVSIPVAGAMPLYARQFSPGSRGDREQFHTELFGEKDSNGDNVTDQAIGIASWLEIFILGGLRRADQDRKNDHARLQIQVLNYFDSCCFSGPVYKSYADYLERITQDIDRGTWRIFIDDSHQDHVISPLVLEKVLQPLFEK